ncbi:hypothetical protein N7486_000806 [Penicillium sp. IBT 16267x]|nr:hypothetical protein N7486_000806 [Penicillium sp. IBT 16267x]
MQNAYAEELKRVLTADKLHVDVDLRDSTLNKKIRTGQQEKYDFIFVVGFEEKRTRRVNVRNRDDPESQT